MAFTKSEKAFCVLEFAKTDSCTLVQRVFRTKFRKAASERKSMLRWHDKCCKAEATHVKCMVTCLARIRLSA